MLGSDSSDPSFAPEQTSTESLGLLMATVDEDIESIFLDLPENEPALEPLRGRGEEVRERLRLLTSVGGAGRVIRHHGDFHLGQTLCTPTTAGCCSTSRASRRARSPSGGASAARCATSPGCCGRSPTSPRPARCCAGPEPPPGWEAIARAEFLAGYSANVDPSLAPVGRVDGQAAAGVRVGESGLRAALRALQPARLDPDPRRRHRAHARGTGAGMTQSGAGASAFGELDRPARPSGPSRAALGEARRACRRRRRPLRCLGAERARGGVVGDFNGWDAVRRSRRARGRDRDLGGVVAGAAPGAALQVRDRRRGRRQLKADPLAFCAEPPPQHRLRRLRARATSGRTATGSPRGGAQEPLDRADVDLRGAPRLVVAPLEGNRPSRTSSWPTSSRLRAATWASRTSSCCR